LWTRTRIVKVAWSVTKMRLSEVIDDLYDRVLSCQADQDEEPVYDEDVDVEEEDNFPEDEE